MKKNIFLTLCFLSFFFSQIFSQPIYVKSIDLNIAPTTSKEYVARDYITLSQNFTFSADATKTFVGRIDESVVVDVEYMTSLPNPNRDIDKTLTVGSIPGVFNVSPTGAATYTIPIDVPPGTADMHPNIVISYNSHGGNGMLGAGFSLSGLSVITRAPTNLYHEDYNDPVDFDNNDKFALDGNRLIQITTGTYGGDNESYRTEIETFSVIKSFGTAGSGPEYFKVYSKDGKTIEYGTNFNSRLQAMGKLDIISWYISKVTDINGNYIEYDYIKDPSTYEVRLNEIRYTGTTTFTPYNKIAFYYENRTSDPMTSYIGGTIVKQTKLLYSIKTFSNTELVKKFEFKYSEDYYSHLSEIIEYNSNGEHLNSSIFEWGNKKERCLSEIPEVSNNFTDYVNCFPYMEGDLNPASYEGVFRGTYSGDLHGDGIDDLVLYFTGNRKNFDVYYDFLIVYPRIYSEGNIITVDDKRCYNLDASPIIDENDKIESPGIVINDFNGDSKDEIMAIDQIGQAGVKWHCYGFNEGENFEKYNSSNLTHTDIDPSVHFGEDINADGILDLIIIAKDGETIDGIQNHKTFLEITNIDGTFNEVSFYLPVYGSRNSNKFRTGDFNGDGLIDLIFIFDTGAKIFLNSGSSPYFSNSSAFVSFIFNSNDKYIYGGDFNGDGLSDFLINRTGTEWFFALNGYKTFTKKDVNIPSFDDTDNEHFDNDYCIITSIDNDNRSDIIVVDERDKWDGHGNKVYDRTEWYYYTVNKNLDLVQVEQFNNSDRINQGYYTASNFNGDSYPGFVKYSTTEDKFYYHYYHPTIDKNSNLIHSINDGAGLKTTISYENISFPDVYTKGSEDADPNVKKIIEPIPVVSSYTQPNGIIDGTNEIKFTYEGLKLHRKGKGLLGFNKTTVTNTTTNIQTINTYENHPIYYNISLKNSLTQNVNGTTITKISETDLINKVKDSFGNKRIFPYNETNTQTNHLTGLYSIINSYYDDDGNITQHETYYKEGDTEVAKKIIKYTEYADIYANSPNDIINAPSYIETSTSHKDDKDDGHFNYFTKITNIQYNNTNGSVTRTIEFYDKAENVTTDYLYNSIGQITKATITGTGLTPRKKEYEYDNRFRFVTKEKDALDYFTEKTFDSKNGNILWESDIWGNKTYYYYDGFYRLTKTKLPTGKTISSTISFFNGTDIANAFYYTVTSSEEEPDVIVYFDKLGRELYTETKNGTGITVFTKKVYNTKGELTSASLPYFEGGAPINTIYEYDDYSRIKKEIFDGVSTTVYSYPGKTTRIEKQSTEWLHFSEKTIDATGNIVSASDNGGTISYKYHASGQPKQIITPNKTIDITYNPYGQQETLNDPDAGTITYSYNAYGEIISQKDNVDTKTYTMVYDQLGRVTDKTAHDGSNTHYDYYSPEDGQYGVGLLRKVSGPNNMYDSYTYDQFGRILSLTSFIETGQEYTTNTVYDDFGRISEIIYPSSFAVTYHYNTYGTLSEVKRKDNGSTIWKSGTTAGTAMNEFNQWKEYTLGNNLLKAENNYTSYGLPQAIKTKKVSSGTYIQNLEYSFDNVTGNLNWRKDYRHTISGIPFTEDFQYDDLNRLKGHKINGGSLNGLDYLNGNIDHKFDAGDYNYETSRPHTLDNLQNPSSGFPSNVQNITYTPFNKVNTIDEPERSLNVSISYGPDEERRKMVLINSGVTTTTYYNGIFEKEIKGPDTRQLHYISGGDGLAAIYEIKNGVGKMYYILQDNLGSYNIIADENGNIASFNGQLQEYSFDAWGRRRNPNDWSYTGVPAQYLFTRGFTGHEHLDDFNLINMNGRVYEPRLGLFLSPDNFVQAPDYTQNFNRYSYCFNNPLIYTDPSGEIVWAPIIIGAVIGAYMGGTIANDGNYNPVDWNYSSGQTWGYMLGGAVVGGLSGYVGGAIAASEIPMANTLGIMGASLTNSLGTYAYTGGQTDISVSFGVGSYNFSNKTWGGIWNWNENSTLENIGYSFGAWANFSDMGKIGDMSYNVEKKDLINHSAIKDGSGNVVISYGPGNSPKYNYFEGKPGNMTSAQHYGKMFGGVRGTNNYPIHGRDISLKRVNTTMINGYGKMLSYLSDKGLAPYSFVYSSCSTHAGLALWLSGVPNLFIHPYTLQASVWLWSHGITPALIQNSYHLTITK